MKFIIALFFMACQSEITEINMKTNPIWKKTQPGSLNQVYMITGSNQKYLSVLITLSEPNSDFMLVSQSASAIIDMNQQFTQGTTVDIISAQENRLTRNLNIDISKNILPIFISTFDYLAKSNHEIIIKSSDKMGCPNDCSGQGECLQEGCKCSKNYVGNDCHQIAHEINGTEENQLLLKDNATYFYLQFDEYQGKNGEIEFSTLDESQITIYLLKSLSLAYPSCSESQFDENLFEEITVTNQNSQILQFQVIEQIGINNRVVFVALVQNNKATLNVQISLNSTDKTSLPDYAIALIVVFLFLFFVVLVLVVIKIRKQHQKIPHFEDLPISQIPKINQEEESKQLNESNLEGSSIDNSKINFIHVMNNAKILNNDSYLNPDLNQKNFEKGNLNGYNGHSDNDHQSYNVKDDNKSQRYQSDNDICLICKQDLVDGRKSSQTICQHIFHKDCLTIWVKDHQKCPKCQDILSTHNSQSCQLEKGIQRLDVD